MNNVYITTEAVCLDWIVYKHYGYREGALETVLKDERNRHLAEYGPVLPVDVKVYLPDMPASSTHSTVQLLG
ncbi:tail protein X [Vibrio sp. YMD68]|uniref:tail protein X n=1 Tax=Vibrio sp. YMD68 TaxID=3042300 RepID=UPI00249B3797|nr:tail protein X [Vibrio sp. YMD68]WGV98815.1 tail protein X [Vibrio sp. YMD68]WGW01258.1 tail protein X [Vibrio sp. YMD68]